MPDPMPFIIPQTITQKPGERPIAPTRLPDPPQKPPLEVDLPAGALLPGPTKGPEPDSEQVIAGAEIAAVAVLAAASSFPVEPVKTEPRKNTQIKNLFLDNLHLFFGDTHLVPIKNFINPSHELIESRRMSGMNEFDREDYEHDRLIKLLKTMFFRESNGIVSKVFVGGGITIDQLKKKIKKGISLIVPKY